MTNNCTVSMTGMTFTSSRTGAVTSVGAPNPATLATLAPGAGQKVTVSYNVGATGSGTVVLTVTMPTDAINTGSQTVTVTQAGTGIPFGLWGIKPDTLPNGTVWTGGVLSSKSPSIVLSQLAAARNKSPKIGMWFTMTGGDELVFMRADSSFNLKAWKDTLDRAHGGTIQPDGTSSYYDDYLPYIQDGTFQGIVLLDDLAGFKPDVSHADVDSMAAHSKRRFPLLPTAVRDRATELQKRAPVCSSCPGGRLHHSKVDAAWAQFRTQRGAVTTFRDAEITAAQQMKLGLVFGINVTKGIGGTTAIPQDSLLKWGQELLKAGPSDYACGFFMWNNEYPHLASSHMTTLANLAKGHVKAPCKRRP